MPVVGILLMLAGIITVAIALAYNVDEANLRIKALEKRMDSQQKQIDAAVAELNEAKAALVSTQQDVAILSTGVGTLAAKMVDLKQQVADLMAAQQAGTPLDLSGFQLAVDDIVNTASTTKTQADAAAAKLPTE